MNRTKSKFFKGFGAIVLTLAMLITMIPVTEAWADTQDITPPVIESISLAQNGRTDLKVGDKLTLTFSGYDQDSEITWVQAWAGDFPEEFKGAPVKGEGNTYTFEETIYSAMYGDWHITSFLVEDSCGNVTEVEVDFRFTVEKVVNSVARYSSRV